MNKKQKKIIGKLVKKAERGNLYNGITTTLPKKDRYNLTCNQWKDHLSELILVINNIPKVEIPLNKVKFTSHFRNVSIFNWDPIPNPIDSAVYRGKFLTLALFWVKDHSDKICKMIQKEVGGKKGEIRRKALKNIMIKVDLFVVNFLSNDTTYEINIEALLDLTTLEADERNFHRLHEHFINQKSFIVEMLSNPDEIDKPLMWDSIIKLAFMVATNTTHFRNLPKYKKGYKVTDRESLKENIGRLGLAILRHRSKYWKEPVLYNIYTLACPEYDSRFEEVNEAIELNVGIKAIHYLMFIIDNNEFTSYIERVI